jgi:DNA gyrase subunit A
VTKGGYGLKFNPDPHRELSTRSGRRFAKIAEGDEVLGVQPARKGDILAVVTVGCRSLMCEADDVAELAGPGRGVTVIKVEEDDEVIGFGVGKVGAETLIVAETEGGKKIEIGPGHDEVVGRGGKGRPLAKRTTIARVTPAVSETDPGKLPN